MILPQKVRDKYSGVSYVYLSEERGINTEEKTAQKLESLFSCLSARSQIRGYSNAIKSFDNISACPLSSLPILMDLLYMASSLLWVDTAKGYRKSPFPSKDQGLSEFTFYRFIHFKWIACIGFVSSLYIRRCPFDTCTYNQLLLLKKQIQRWLNSKKKLPEILHRKLHYSDEKWLPFDSCPLKSSFHRQMPLYHFYSESKGC